jgi:hypothetical protein
MLKAGHPNLTAVLALTALADLLLLRLASHVFLPGHAGRVATFFLSDVGFFMSHLGGILGVVLVAVVLLRALHSDTIFPRSMRITVTTIGLFFVLLAGAGVLALPVPDRYVAYLRISHAFLAAFVAVGLWHRACPTRLKVLVTLFAAPFALQAATMFCERMGWSSRLAIQGSRLAQGLTFSALLLSPLLVPPLPRRGLRAAAMLAGGLLGFGLLVLTMIRYFGLVQVIALYGLRFELPPPGDTLGKAYAAMVAAAYVGVTVAALAGVASSAAGRLIGYGLILLAATGHQAVTTNHTLFSLCGLCCLALGALRLEIRDPIDRAITLPTPDVSAHEIPPARPGDNSSALN